MSNHHPEFTEFAPLMDLISDDGDILEIATLARITAYGLTGVSQALPQSHSGQVSQLAGDISRAGSDMIDGAQRVLAKKVFAGYGPHRRLRQFILDTVAEDSAPTRSKLPFSQPFTQALADRLYEVFDCSEIDNKLSLERRPTGIAEQPWRVIHDHDRYTAVVEWGRTHMTFAFSLPGNGLNCTVTVSLPLTRPFYLTEEDLKPADKYMARHHVGEQRLYSPKALFPDNEATRVRVAPQFTITAEPSNGASASVFNQSELDRVTYQAIEAIRSILTPLAAGKPSDRVTMGRLRDAVEANIGRLNKERKPTHALDLLPMAVYPTPALEPHFVEALLAGPLKRLLARDLPPGRFDLEPRTWRSSLHLVKDHDGVDLAVHYPHGGLYRTRQVMFTDISESPNLLLITANEPYRSLIPDDMTVEEYVCQAGYGPRFKGDRDALLKRLVEIERHILTTFVLRGVDLPDDTSALDADFVMHLDDRCVAFNQHLNASPISTWIKEELLPENTRRGVGLIKLQYASRWRSKHAPSLSIVAGRLSYNNRAEHSFTAGFDELPSLSLEPLMELLETFIREMPQSEDRVIKAPLI